MVAFAAIALVTFAAAGYLLVTAFASKTPPPAAKVIDIRADMGGFSVKETVRLVLGGGVVRMGLAILATM